MEVQHVESALNLVARGVGDTITSRAVAESAVQRASTVLSPATREIARLAREMLLAER